jgi:hypothetical protein
MNDIDGALFRRQAWIQVRGLLIVLRKGGDYGREHGKTCGERSNLGYVHGVPRGGVDRW